MPIKPLPSTTHPDVHDIPALLETLRETRPPESGVLSAYLATPLTAVAGRTYLLAFRDGVKALRATLEPAVPDSFDAAVARADRHLAEAFVPRQPGLALFSSAQSDYFFAVPLPVRPAGDFTWGSQPALAPLEAILDDQERIAVALFDKGGARLFSVFLGAIEEHQAWASEVPGRHATGAWGGVTRTNVARQHEAHPEHGASRGPRGGGMAAARYARHHENAVQEHARETAHALMDLLRSRPFDRLLLAGPTEAITTLREALPRPLRARLAGELALAADAGDAEVLQATRQAAEAIERRVEVELVDELVDAAGTPRAVLGLDAILAALSEGRVAHLFVADTFPGVGGECQQCGRLVAGPGPCPTCGGPTSPMSELRERIVERALEQGARVETVSGDAAALLLAKGGLGAWARY